MEHGAPRTRCGLASTSTLRANRRWASPWGPVEWWPFVSRCPGALRDR
nr:MAG TPA: hypothetical protein [Caudoviricetes sp.]